VTICWDCITRKDKRSTTQFERSGWKIIWTQKNDAHETFMLVYNKNINALVQDLTSCNKVDNQNMPPCVGWSFRNKNDPHEMTLPSPQRPYNLMLMMKRRHER
jgi:hypothetical protein